MIKLPDYDFLGSIYIKTNYDELYATLESINSQTLKPKNIILVIDGKITKEVRDLVIKYKKIIPIKTIPLIKNVGLGLALRKGLENCKSDIILRFDTDDINTKNRALLTVEELAKGNADIVGSNIREFIDDPNLSISRKIMPLTHKSIKRMIFFRNPINHPTVGFLRKSIIELNGGYRHFPFYEDYDLWIRALLKGLKFKNINRELVFVRIANQRLRRKGFNLISSECRLFLTFFNESILHALIFLPFLFLRIIFTLLPLKVDNFLITKILRK